MGRWFRRRPARRELNRALHELRRPLQLLCLRLEGEGGEGGAASSAAVLGDMRMIRAALADLDRVVNGDERGFAEPGWADGEGEAFRVGDLVEEVAARWRPLLAREGRELRISARGTDTMVAGDPCRVAQALDGLISNAAEHGSGTVGLSATVGKDRLRVSLTNRIGGGDGSGGREGREGSGVKGRRGDDPRHGLGLDLATEIMSDCGGQLMLAPGRRRYEAVVSLPVAA